MEDSPTNDTPLREMVAASCGAEALRKSDELIEKVRAEASDAHDTDRRRSVGIDCKS